MASTPSLVQHARGTARYYLGGLYRLISDRPVFLWAQAIAFKVLVTIVPVLFLAVAIMAQVLRQQDAFTAVSAFISNFLPPYNSQRIIQALDQLQSSSYALTAIGLAGLLFSAMTLFTTLRIVVSNIFQEEWHEQRSIVMGYVFDLRMAAQVGLLFLLSLALTAAMQTFNAAGIELLADLGLDYRWVTTGWRRLITLAGLLVPFVVTALMFMQLFYFIPKPHPPKRSALLGAATASLLWELAKNLFAWYATNVARFERYEGATSGDSAIQGLGDAFGLIIAFVFWVYFSGVILVIGGLVALLHEKRRRARLRDDDPADDDPADDDRAAPAASDGSTAADGSTASAAASERSSPR